MKYQLIFAFIILFFVRNGLSQPKLLLDIENGISSSTALNYSGKVINNKLYFVARTIITGEELYVTDGTPQGTRLVKDINTTNLKDASPIMFMQSSDKLLFAADDGINGKELWISDGSETGTNILKDIFVGTNSGMDLINSNLQNYISDNNIGYFAAQRNLSEGIEFWSSDGTANGTNLIKDINSVDNSNPKWFSKLNGKIYFTAKSDDYGGELYSYDPQTKATSLVKDIFPGKNGSTISNLTAVGSNLMFSAYESSGFGTEPYISDGTTGGTKLLKDIKSGSGNSNPSRFFYVNGKVFFRANDSLYVTDGTEAGTINLGLGLGTDFPSLRWATDGQKLLLPASKATDNVGRELYVSDGTLAGTKLLKDIRRFANPSDPKYLLYANKLFYFTADNGTNGEELWVSDGTDIGTKLLYDFLPGALGSTPHDLVFFNKYLFFYANDQVIGDEPYVLELQVVKNEDIESEKLLVSENENSWLIRLKENEQIRTGKLTLQVSDIQGREISKTIVQDYQSNNQIIEIKKPDFKGVFIVSLINGNQILNAKVISK